MFNLPGEIPLQKLSDRIVGMGDPDPTVVIEFKKLFVMYAVCSVLAPNFRNVVDYTMCCALENVDQISKMDWCGFVLNRLSTSVISYKKAKSYNAVNACLPVLLCFFYRFPFQGVQDSLELPLCKDWTSKKITARATNMVKAGFDSVLMSKINFPLSTRSQPPKRFIHVELTEGVGDEDIDMLGLSVTPLVVATLKLKKLVTLAIDDYAMSLARINGQRASEDMSQQQDMAQNVSEQNGSQQNASQQNGSEQNASQQTPHVMTTQEFFDDPHTYDLINAPVKEALDTSVGEVVDARRRDPSSPFTFDLMRFI